MVTTVVGEGHPSTWPDAEAGTFGISGKRFCFILNPYISVT
jgi:hypothetical protein